MKRQERHHLKENELARSVAAVRAYVEPRAGRVRMVVGGVVIVLALALIVMLVRQRSSSKAEEMLAEGLVVLNARVIPTSDPELKDLPESAQLNNTGTFRTEGAKLRAAVPKLKAAADEYPGQQAGIIARYHLAGSLAALGQNQEAATEFATVAQRAGENSFYGRMAMLGQADSLTRAGQLDAAIASWKKLAEKKDDSLPADVILMSLARAYVAKGNTAEARKTFTELVDQHPDSPYLPEAREELAGLKG
jgi:tetratricopeptide (TPR) repeat protein